MDVIAYNLFPKLKGEELPIPEVLPVLPSLQANFPVDDFVLIKSECKPRCPYLHTESVVNMEGVESSGLSEEQLRAISRHIKTHIPLSTVDRPDQNTIQ